MTLMATGTRAARGSARTELLDTEVTGRLVEAAEYHRATDPLERVLGYLNLWTGWAQGTVAEFTCLVGTMVQEAHTTSPARSFSRAPKPPPVSPRRD